MSTPDSDSSSGYGTGGSGKTTRLPATKILIALIVMVVIMGIPWWLTLIPEFGFTN